MILQIEAVSPFLEAIANYGFTIVAVVLLSFIMYKWVMGDRATLAKLREGDIVRFESLEKQLTEARGEIRGITDARLADEKNTSEQLFQVLQRYMDITQANQTVMQDLHTIIKRSNAIFEKMAGK